MQPTITDGPGLSEAQFQRVSSLARTGWGLKLEPSKRSIIQSRFRRRMAARGCTDLDAYFDLVAQGDTEECTYFVKALTTNITQFYRELYHFEALETEILPRLLENGDEESIKIWSAGCSSGQEPYSIAASVFAVCPEDIARRARILATDIDNAVLSTAQSATYRLEDCDFPTDAHRERVFGSSEQENSQSVRVRESLRNIVTIRHLNLAAPWPLSGAFDVIFCRNVTIYFHQSLQHSVWKGFVRHLKPGGTLFVGHSERIADPGRYGLRLVGKTTYRLESSEPPVMTGQEIKWL